MTGTMNRFQDMSLRNVLNIALNKLQDMDPFDISLVLKKLDGILCRGSKDSNISDDTYVLLDKLCKELVFMETYRLSNGDVKRLEHILIEGINFNRLTKKTLCLIKSLFYTDNISSKLKNTKKFICVGCGKDIITCLEENDCY